MKTIKLVRTLVIAGLFAFTINSCQKYEDGGLLGAADREIVNAWKVVEAIDLQDGSDKTSDFNGEIWEFTKDNYYKENGTLKGTYTFSSDMLTLIILESDGDSDAYKILKLKSNEMWLEEIGSKEIHLIPVN